MKRTANLEKKWPKNTAKAKFTKKIGKKLLATLRQSMLAFMTFVVRHTVNLPEMEKTMFIVFMVHKIW